MCTPYDVALRLGFHKMAANDMARKCRAMLDACPHCEFDGLGGRARATATSRPTARPDACGNRGNDPEAAPRPSPALTRGTPCIYKGYYGGTFIELDADLRALTGIDPRNDRRSRRRCRP